MLRRFDCLLAPTRAQVLAQHEAIKDKPESVVRSLLEKITGRPFYNLARLDFARLLDDPNQLAPNLNGYIAGFSPSVRAFELGIRRLIESLMIERMAENDKIVTRYMADRDFQGSAFPILAREIFEAIRAGAAGGAPR